MTLHLQPDAGRAVRGSVLQPIMSTFSSNRRLRAAAIHLGISVGVAAVVAIVVFLVWYPPPFADLSGGTFLFKLLVAVDVVLGPLLTFVLAAPGKPKGELARDIALVAVLQAGAFAYGVSVMAAARPVYLVFEVDRLRVVSAVDVEGEPLREAPAALRELPWTGPRLIGVRKPQDPAAQLRSIDLALAGRDLAFQPEHWAPYEALQADAWHAGRPVELLARRYPSTADALRGFARDAGRPVEALRFLPVMSRTQSWVAVLADPGARIVGYLPVDGFF